MPKLVSKPKLQYKCACGAVSEAEECEFKKDNTIPPRFHAECAFCGSDVVCFPEALVVKDATNYARIMCGG